MRFDAGERFAPKKFRELNFGEEDLKAELLDNDNTMVEAFRNDFVPNESKSIIY